MLRYAESGAMSIAEHRSNMDLLTSTSSHLTFA